MNGKFEEKLIRLAFGETNPKESSALERQAQSDPEAMRLLGEFRQVRTELDLLTDIPPDQLSKERLRDAILGQGLKPLPVPSSSRFGWTWMPATAFALAFGWFAVRHLNAPTPQIVDSRTSAVAMHTETALKVPSGPAFVSSALNTAKVATAKSQKPADLSSHVALRRKPSDTFTPRPFLAISMKNAENAAKQVVAIMNRGQTVQESLSVAPPKSVPDHSDNPVKVASINTPMVVINPENDNNSGAQKATEVDGASNVVVGG